MKIVFKFGCLVVLMSGCATTQQLPHQYDQTTKQIVIYNPPNQITDVGTEVRDGKLWLVVKK